MLPLATLVFLVLAVLSGLSVSNRAGVDTFQHFEVFGSGFQRLKNFMASVLYLELDKYHHIEMYQGVSWTEATDYLPQMWLITHLDPHFTDVYTDAAFHLAVNLGQVEEGMAFIREGVANNPDSLDVRFEYAYLLWVTGTGTGNDILKETLAYRDLLRRAEGDLRNPYYESSSATIMAEFFQAETDSLNPYYLFYSRRASFVRLATQQGLFYPDYLSPPPHYFAVQNNGGSI
jgi:hypothetical protein